MSYVKVCPKCKSPNPEDADLCEADGEFLGTVPPTWQAEVRMPDPPVARDAPPPDREKVPQPSVAGMAGADKTAITARWEPAPTLQLEWPEHGVLLTLRGGETLGQEHPSRLADIPLSPSLPGVGQVHRLHARIVCENSVWQVIAIDQKIHGSSFTNPTFVNNIRVLPGTGCPLRHGDTLTLSGVALNVRIAP